MMCTRRRWFFALESAWSEIPVDAASLMSATSFLPSWKASFSRMLRLSIWKWVCPDGYRDTDGGWDDQDRLG